jgi:hypothetical protein
MHAVTMRGALAVLIAALVAVFVSPQRVPAQEPSLKEVLKNAAGYVADFQKQLSGIVAEETYTQEILKERGTPSLTKGNLVIGPPRRTLRSDLLLVKPGGADRYVEFRDVFEVDGAAVRDRDQRLARLIGDSSPGSFDRMREIINQSARFNIGSIQRNVNTPVLALTFLDTSRQPRFEFKRASRERERIDPTGATPSPETPADPGVFRVSTEMWAIEYRERERPTLIRTPRGQPLPARGRFWINPVTGAVLISELVVDGGGVEATITVSYQSEPLVGFLVPVAMHESYEGHGEHVVGTALYGRFRQIVRQD